MNRLIQRRISASKIEFRIRNLLAVLMMVFGSLASGTPLALAQEGTPELPEDSFTRTFVFHPADTGILTAFYTAVEPGDAVDLAVLIGNTGTVEQDILVYPVNVFTGVGGGMVPADYGEDPSPVTQWVEFTEETVTITPGHGVERTFTVRVPEDTPPGEYIAAVAAQHAEAYEVEGVESFRQRSRYVTPIFITVPGEMSAEFSFGEPALNIVEDVLSIRVPVHNTGDTHVRPAGVFTLRDQGGNIIATAPVTMQTVFARESTTLTLGVPGGLPVGQYQIEGTFSDADTGASAAIERATFEATVAATPEPARFRIGSTSVVAAPAADNVQFVTLEADIVNSGEPANGVQLSLIAFLNGEEVERFPINQSLSLPTGETPITTRYIPATGFTEGEWSFELVLETVTPNGAAVVVARTMIEETIEVGD